MNPELHVTHSQAAKVEKLADETWHLEIPAHPGRGYRLAQLDDHGSRLRRDFFWRPPLKLSLQARVSDQDLPGTWGFGFWNDPFSLIVGYSGISPRLPVLPDALWFFHASPESHLSFRDGLPPNGFLAATFDSLKFPAILYLSSPILALTLIPGLSRLARRFLKRLVHQDAQQLHTTPTGWHVYSLEWEADRAIFSLDERPVLQTDVVPKGPLCLVIWIDNQYAALPPGGRLQLGMLSHPKSAWLEIKALTIQRE
jgi:hypothetical protein